MMQANSASKSTKRVMLGLLASFALLVGCTHSITDNVPETRWVELMDGETLDGWTQVNGKAPYEIIDGAIRGTNVLDTPNSFLATNGTYSDFVLEFESRSIGDANSGVQFRTELAPGTWSGLIGYQLDIDPTERRWTGGIYHEGVHVWRHSMARNVDCQAAYQHGEWNRYRIEAAGAVIATWVNDIPCAHMVGDHHDTGVIALQVHSIGQEAAYLGSYTEWRSIRILEEPTPNELWLERRNDLVEGWLENDVSEIEAEHGWRSLQFINGTATFEAPGGNFEIVMDMQVGASAEGALNYELVRKNRTCSGAYKILDDSSLAESRSESDLMGSVPGKHSAQNLSEPGRPKRYYPDDRWNRVRLIVKADTIEHWLNSVKVVEYDQCASDVATPMTTEETPHSMRPRFEVVTENGPITTRNAKVRLISE